MAACFRTSAASPDGVVECYESVDEDWFCLGVQFHPEDDTASALDMQIFQEFLAACPGEQPSVIPMPHRAAA